jgi:hypothetical protein
VLQCKGIIMLLCTRQLIGPSTLCACFRVVLIDNHQVTLLFGRVVVIGGQPTNEPIYGWMDGWMDDNELNDLIKHANLANTFQ